MDQSMLNTPDILVAFETSMIEIEILAKKARSVKLSKDSVNMNQVILVNFLFRTRPEMNYQQEGYQRGPLHIGRVAIQFRAYAWTDEQVNDYKKLKDIEDFRLMELIDTSVKAAMDALGDELMRYLEEAGSEMFPDKKKEAAEKPKALKQFFPGSLRKEFNKFFQINKAIASKSALSSSGKMSSNDAFKIDIARSSARSSAKSSMWTIYHHFKKHHGMLNW